MVRKLIAGMIVVALLLAAVVGLLTWQFSGLVTPRIESYLAGHGVETLTTSEVRWRFNRLRIEDLHAQGQIGTLPFSLHLERVDIGYQWWHLFKGTIDSVVVGSAHIELDVSQPGDDKSDTAPLAIAPLLPQSWLAAMPVARLTLHTVTGLLQLPDGGELSLAGSAWRLAGAHLEATVAVREQRRQPLPAGDSILLLVAIASSPDKPLELSAGLTSNGQLVGNMALSQAAAAVGQQLVLSVNSEVHHAKLQQLLSGWRHSDAVPLGGGDDWLQSLPPLAGESHLALAVQLPAEMTGEFGDWLLAAEFHGAVQHHLSWQSWPTPALGEVTAKIDYGLAGTPQAFEVLLNKPLVMAGSFPQLGSELPESFAAWRQQEVPVRLQLATPSPLLITEGVLRLVGAEVLVTVGPEGEDLRLTAELSDLAVENNQFKTTAEAVISLYRGGQILLAPQLSATVASRHEATAGGQDKDDIEGTTHWQLTGDIVEAGLRFTAQWQLSVAADGGYQLSVSGGSSDLPGVLKAAGALVPLELPLALSEGAGQLDYRLTAAAESVSRQRLHVELTGLAGLLQGMAVENAQLAGTLESAAQWRSADAFTLKVDQFNAGIAVNDIVATLRLLPSPTLQQTRWSVDQFEARLFGGTAHLAAPFEWQQAEPESRFELTLSNWQLADVFALYADHGLSGSGVLHGVIPVQLDTEGVSVHRGELASQQPGGLIVYDGGEAGKAVTTGNQQLNLALLLLHNFHYQNLAVRADFTPRGDLTLGLQLMGHNPDEFSGQAVNFNINIEENIFDLLLAQRLTDDVIRDLEKRLQ